RSCAVAARAGCDRNNRARGSTPHRRTSASLSLHPKSEARTAEPLRSAESPHSLPIGPESTDQALQVTVCAFQVSVTKLHRVQLSDPPNRSLLLLADPIFIDRQLRHEVINHIFTVKRAQGARRVGILRQKHNPIHIALICR